MNNMLQIIFFRDENLFPPQDIGSLMLSLNLIHPLVNEVRQQMWKMVLPVSRSTETASHCSCRSLSLYPLSLYCFLSETETSCSHTSGWTCTAICLFCSGMLLNNGIFFNPCPRIKLQLFTFSFTFMLWNMHSWVWSMTECAICMTSIPFYYFYFF